jgi:TusA-related sulfurtransferase
MELIARMKYGSVGDTFELLSTDDGSSVDVPEWVRKAKHELVGSEKVAGVWHITVRKAR